MLPKHISILGIGLLGGSIGLAARSRINGCRITGYAHRRATIDAAVAMGAVDAGFDKLAPAMEGADLVILCTPVGLFRSLLGELTPLLAPQAVITDVGSTKRSIVADAERLLKYSGQFVGSHPMAGSEKRGVQFAKADLYDGALCIITPTAQTDAGALDAIEKFWGVMGMRTCRLTPEEHDRRLADVSHLPHALAAALASIQDEKSVELAGNGFLDMTRIAAGDGTLWRDILLDNKDNVRRSIGRLKDRLDTLSTLLDESQSEALRAWLDEVAAQRQKMIDARARVREKLASEPEPITAETAVLRSSEPSL